MSLFNRPGMERAKFKTKTVAVVATTKSPALCFRVRGRVVELGEEVRLPVDDAKDLERRGKARIVPDSEAVELL
jgi:hypothetical protein